MVALWQQPAPVEEKKIEMSPITQEEAEEAAIRTRELLGRDGYCLWRCRILNGEVIIVLNNDYQPAPAVPGGYPVYLLSELDKIQELPEKTIRLVHRVKKLAGRALVISVEDRK